MQSTDRLGTNSVGAADVIAAQLSSRHQLVQRREAATNLPGGVLQRAWFGAGSFFIRGHGRRLSVAPAGFEANPEFAVLI